MNALAWLLEYLLRPIDWILPTRRSGFFEWERDD